MPSLPRVLLHLEGAAVFVACIAWYAQTGWGFGAFLLWILAPDLSMLAYLAGPRIGSYAYDAVHTYVGPLAAGALAIAGVLPYAIALIWAAHIGADRALGFGLKYSTAFKETHLQRV